MIVTQPYEYTKSQWIVLFFKMVNFIMWIISQKRYYLRQFFELLFWSRFSRKQFQIKGLCINSSSGNWGEGQEEEAEKSGQHQSGCLTELTSAKYNSVLDSLGPFMKKIPNCSGRSICRTDGKPLSPGSHLSWSKRSPDSPALLGYTCMGATWTCQYPS